MTPEHVAAVVSRWTGVPVDKMLEGERDKLLRMEEALGARVIGQRDAVTAVSGSGPAYFFYLMEAMVEAGLEQGLDAETATVLTLETAYGAALMARERTSTPAELRANVTSPGGTTAAAISALDAADAGATIRGALAAAGERSKTLAEEFGK